MLYFHLGLKRTLPRVNAKNMNIWKSGHVNINWEAINCKPISNKVHDDIHALFFIKYFNASFLS